MTGNQKTSELVQPQLLVRSFSVVFGSVSVFFLVHATEPVNTTQGTFSNAERRDEMSAAAAKEETNIVDYNLRDADKSLGACSFSSPPYTGLIFITENQTPFDSQLEGLDSHTLSEHRSAIYSLFNPNYDSTLVTLGSHLGSSLLVAN